MRSIVIGIGNPYRSDDAVGWQVIDALQNKIHHTCVLSKQGGDIVDLMDAFMEYDAVYIVDACTLLPVGTWQRIDAHVDSILTEKNQTSTHGLSVSEAIALARNLQQLPNKLILYAICGNDFSIGNKSNVMVETVNQVVDSILQEEDIQLCMNKV